MKQAQAQAARAPLNKVWGCQENTPVILIHKQIPEPRIMLDEIVGNTRTMHKLNSRDSKAFLGA